MRPPCISLWQDALDGSLGKTVHSEASPSKATEQIFQGGELLSRPAPVCKPGLDNNCKNSNNNDNNNNSSNNHHNSNNIISPERQVHHGCCKRLAGRLNAFSLLIVYCISISAACFCSCLEAGMTHACG